MKRKYLYYTDFIKGRLEVIQGSRVVTIHVGRISIRNMNGMFERSEILLKKYRELLVRAQEIQQGPVRLHK